MSRQGIKFTEEHKKRLAVSHIGKTLSKEIKSKISMSRIGKQHSEDTRVKMSHSTFIAWANRRGGIWYGNVVYNDRPMYCERFNEIFKERVRAYFGYRCFECGVMQTDRKLDVHHVHYDKKMCCNGSPKDVVPLCHSCHMQTNGNRDWWESHFTELIYSENPDGKCFFTKEEMKNYMSELARPIQ
jgi:hypothetical protein